MKIIETEIPGVLLIEPQVFGDERGWFVETWQQQRYAEQGMPGPFVQDNQAFSQRGVLRGLHLQHPHGQGKLVQVISGEVFDVAVDVRRGSPCFGRWVGTILSDKNRHQFYVPEGFAHGYCVLSDEAIFSYKCTDNYHPESQISIRWDDPDLGIDWPLAGVPILSDKDREAPCLHEISEDRLPPYRGE